MLSGTYKFPVGHPWPTDWTSLIEQCLLPNLQTRADLNTIRSKFETISKPPDSTAFHVIPARDMAKSSADIDIDSRAAVFDAEWSECSAHGTTLNGATEVNHTVPGRPFR